jgi:hypothetical protein
LCFICNSFILLSLTLAFSGAVQFFSICKSHLCHFLLERKKIRVCAQVDKDDDGVKVDGSMGKTKEAS